MAGIRQMQHSVFDRLQARWRRQMSSWTGGVVSKWVIALVLGELHVW